MTDRAASVELPGDGSTVLWDFAFQDGYMDTSHVFAKARDNLTGLETPITVTPEMFEGPFRLRIEPAVGAAQTLIIYRKTPSIPMVDWPHRARIDRDGLEVTIRQPLMVAVENAEAAIDAQAAAEAAIIAAAAAQAAADAIGDAVEDAQAAAQEAEAAKDICEADRVIIEAIYQDLLDNPPADAGIVAQLNKDSALLSADTGNHVTDYTPANGKMVVYNGNSIVSTGLIAFSITSQVGGTASIAADGTFNITNIPDGNDGCIITFRATYAGVNRDKKFSVLKVKSGVPGDDGDDGLPGSNAATVILHKRSPTSPAVPDNDITYTFATAALSGSLDGWSVAIPSGTDPCWAIVASFVGEGVSDTVTPAEWTTPQIIGKNGDDGLSVATVWLFTRTATATPPTKPSTSTTYTFATGVATGMNNGWTQTIPASGGPYRWMISATAAAAAATDVIPNTEWADPAIVAQDGTSGVDGLNTVVLTLYKRAPSAPSGLSGDVTYTFSTAVATGLTNGWQQSIPAGTDPIWAISGSAVSAANTDVITAAEFTSAVKLADSGGDGLNNATVFLFQRTASATPPAKPTSAVTYTFATGVATGGLGSWTQTLPTSGGKYAWLTTATASSTGASDSIPTTEWATVAAVAIDGADGLNSAAVNIYKRSATVPAVPSVTVTYTFSTAALTGLNNGWTQDIPAGTDPLWVTSGSFVSATNTDTLTTGEWPTPIKFVENGLHHATLFLYKRTLTDVAPALLTSTTTYTFDSGILTGMNNGWTQGIPDIAGGPYLWVTTATALATTATDSIPNTEWATVRRMAADGLDGEDGADAVSLGLYCTSQMFTFASDNVTAVPTSQTITFTLVLNNLSGTATWVATKYDANGTSLGAATLGGTGNTRTLTVANFGTAHHLVITATIGSHTDTATLIRLYPGANGQTPVQADLDNDAHTFPADSSGQVTTYAGGSSRMKVYLGLADDSANWTYTKVASTGVTATLGTGADKNLCTVTAMTTAVDSGYVDITATRAGYPTQMRRFSISKAKSAAGTSGLIMNFQCSSSDLELDGVQTATARITLGSDGIITTLDNDIAKTDKRWFAPATAGIGSSYWVMASGSPPATGFTGTLNTWISLNTNPAWILTRTAGQGVGLSSMSIQFIIASDASGTNIVSAGFGILAANQDQ